jgi:hypothetical protein
MPRRSRARTFGTNGGGGLGGGLAAMLGGVGINPEYTAALDTDPKAAESMKPFKAKNFLGWGEEQRLNNQLRFQQVLEKAGVPTRLSFEKGLTDILKQRAMDNADVDLDKRKKGIPIVAEETRAKSFEESVGAYLKQLAESGIDPSDEGLKAKFKETVPQNVIAQKGAEAVAAKATADANKAAAVRAGNMSTLLGNEEQNMAPSIQATRGNEILTGEQTSKFNLDNLGKTLDAGLKTQLLKPEAMNAGIQRDSIFGLPSDYSLFDIGQRRL